MRGQIDQDLDAHGVLAGCERRPTWMWANEEVAEFLDWLREENARRPTDEQVGFYGLDVYSLWDSLREIVSWLEHSTPDALLRFEVTAALRPLHHEGPPRGPEPETEPTGC